MSDTSKDYSFGAWLRHFRNVQGITLRAAAEELKISPGNYSKLERSQLSPPSKESALNKYIKVFKLNAMERELLRTAAFNHHVGMLKKRWER